MWGDWLWDWLHFSQKSTRSFGKFMNFSWAFGDGSVRKPTEKNTRTDSNPHLNSRSGLLRCASTPCWKCRFSAGDLVDFGPRYNSHEPYELYMIWVFPRIGVPQNRWFIMENLIKMDDLGVHPYESLKPLKALFSSETWHFLYLLTGTKVDHHGGTSGCGHRSCQGSHWGNASLEESRCPLDVPCGMGCDVIDGSRCRDSRIFTDHLTMNWCKKIMATPDRMMI